MFFGITYPFNIMRWSFLPPIMFLILKSSLFDLNIATSTFFQLASSSYIFSHSIILKLFVCLLNIISQTQYIVRSCFYIQCDCLCLLSDFFKPFTFNVFVNIVRLKCILLPFAFCFICSLFPVLLSTFFLIQYFFVISFLTYQLSHFCQ